MILQASLSPFYHTDLVIKFFFFFCFKVPNRPHRWSRAGLDPYGDQTKTFTLPLEARGKSSSSQSAGTPIGFSPE